MVDIAGSRPSRIAPRLGALFIASGLACAVLVAFDRDREAARRGDQSANSRAAAHDGRGRSADRPSDIPARGWRDILKRVQQSLSANNAGLISAGVAFYALMALFPALGALVMLYGLVADAGKIGKLLDIMSGVVPAQVMDIIGQQLTALTKQPSAGLSIAGLVGLALALWSARQGITSLITALNVAYEERERRSFVKQTLLSLSLTVGLIIEIVIALFLIAGVPAIVTLLPIGEVGKLIGQVARWPLLALLAIFGLAVIFRYGPSREKPKWRWVSWGSVTAAALWLAASALFSLYVSTIGSYDKTYGSLGGVIVLLMWFYISVYVVLLGAELNAEMEHQTAKDTTEGRQEPMGRRGAHMADTLGSPANAVQKGGEPESAARLAKASG
jgi:membrane protein